MGTKRPSYKHDISLSLQVINTEWGAFGDNGELDFVVTKWDRAVDEMSVNPGKQIFEKMISGMYMGELIRQVLVDLMKDDLIFFEANREKILERGTFLTMSASVFLMTYYMAFQRRRYLYFSAL